MPFIATFKENALNAYFEVSWKIRENNDYEIVPTTAFYNNGAPIKVTLMPSHFTIESTDATTHTVPDDPYTVTLQIRDASGVEFDTGSDTIDVTFTHTDSEGGEVVTLTTPATHLSSGL